mgnify:CR=1 FL=1
MTQLAAASSVITLLLLPGMAKLAAASLLSWCLHDTKLAAARQEISCVAAHKPRGQWNDTNWLQPVGAIHAPIDHVSCNLAAG